MKTDKKRSFKGAVLFTVVSVMSLLIVFLTSTLVLATAANNRAHKSYSSSQASYTARAAIDSILKAASEDDSFATAMAGLTAGNGFDVDVTMENSIAGIGRVEKARVEFAGKKQFYDTATQEWTERDLLSITADVTSGGETKTVTAYALKNPPQVGGGGGGGGGFVTVGSASSGTAINSFGGTYLGIGMGKGKRYYQGDYSLATGQIISLDDKLYLNLKDTDQPGYMDASGNYLPNLPENADIVTKFTINDQNAFVAPVVINGSLDFQTQSQLAFPTKGSGMAVWGNLSFLNGRLDIVSETVNNNNSAEYKQEITKFSEIPYIYVDSLMKFNVGFTFGNSNLPLNIFCGSFDGGNSDIYFYADIYCQDKDKTSYLGTSGSTPVLHAWSNSVLNGTETYLNTVTSGNFYTKGNLVINGGNGRGADIDGDLVVEGDLTVNGRLNVGGSVVVGGTLTVNEDINVGAGHSICADIATGSKIEADLSKKMTADGSQELYEEKQQSTGYCVLAKNVRIKTGPNLWDVENIGYAWLKPEAMTSLGLTDNDGDGIVDGNVADLHFMTEIDSSLVVEKLWGGLGWGQDEHSITKEYMETYWENREDGTTTTNELDTYDSNGFKHNGVNIAGTDFYKNTHNGEMFPRKAEKAVILGFEDINGGTDSTLIQQSKVLQTVEEIEQDYNFDNNSITAIPADGNYLADVNANVYTSSNLPAEITTSCTLQGGFSQDIVIKNTSTNDIWVKLDNFVITGSGNNFIYDDSSAGCGNLNVFVENNASFLTGCSMLTKTYKDYFDNNTKFQIVTNNFLIRSDGGTVAKCPKINVYAPKAVYNPDGTIQSQPKFSADNSGTIVTAAIEAPGMKFTIVNARTLGNTVYYDAREVQNYRGDGVGNKDVGVIGILNVESCQSVNDWIFLYTPKDVQPHCTCVGCSCGGGSACATCGLPCTGHCTCSGGGVGDNSYVVMYYEGF